MQLIKAETDRINVDLAKNAAASGNLLFSNRGMEAPSSGGGNSPADAKSAGSAVVDEDFKTSSVPKKLNDRVSKMLKEIELELDNAELSIGNRMHVLDTDRDGIISQQELEQALTLIKEQLSECL